MSSIRVDIHAGGPAESGDFSSKQTLEFPVESTSESDRLAGLIYSLEKARAETNALLTKHVEEARSKSTTTNGDDKDLENDFMEEDPEDTDDEEGAKSQPIKKAKASNKDYVCAVASKE